MEVLTLQGKQYVKASKAAADLGYAKDYVGQLCRSGAVDAHLVGRTWYVNIDTLGTHRIEKKRNARVKAREYAKKSIEESKKLHVSGNTNKAKNIDIRYEDDQESLIPRVKKVAVVSEMRQKPAIEEVNDGPRYEVLNANNKILMSGELEVHDAEAEPELTDTVLLTPMIKRRRRTITLENVGPVNHNTDDDDIDEELKLAEVEKVSFTERLNQMQNNAIQDTEAVSGDLKTEELLHSPNLPLKKGQVMFVFLLYLLSFAMLFSISLANVFIYSDGLYKHGYEIHSDVIFEILDKI